MAPRDGATLVAGQGSDTFSLSLTGADTIVFAKGDGHTTITNPGDGYTRSDVLALADLLPSDVTLTRSGDALTIAAAATGDRIDVPYQFYGSDPDAPYGVPAEQGVATLSFADGTSWDRDEIAAAAPLRAGDGDATLQAPGNCDATLVAGAGNDTFTGGYGNDTFVYAARDGNLTVNNYDNYFGAAPDAALSFADLAPGDLSFTRQNDDLAIAIAGTGHTVDVAGQFDPRGTDGVAQIRFADGTTRARPDIARHARAAA